MRAFLFSMSLLAVLAIGCTNSTPEPAPVEKEAPPTTAASETDDNGLLAEVDKDALASALAAHDVTLIEFTATW